MGLTARELDCAITFGQPSCHWHWKGRAGGEAVPGRAFINEGFFIILSLMIAATEEAVRLMSAKWQSSEIPDSVRDFAGRIDKARGFGGGEGSRLRSGGGWRGLAGIIVVEVNWSSQAQPLSLKLWSSSGGGIEGFIIFKPV